MVVDHDAWNPYEFIMFFALIPFGSHQAEEDNEIYLFREDDAEASFRDQHSVFVSATVRSLSNNRVWGGSNTIFENICLLMIITFSL